MDLAAADQVMQLQQLVVLEHQDKVMLVGVAVLLVLIILMDKAAVVEALALLAVMDQKEQITLRVMVALDCHMIFLENLNSTPEAEAVDLGTQRLGALIQAEKADQELAERVDVDQLIMDLKDKMVFRIQDLEAAVLQVLHNQEMADMVPTVR